MLFFNDAGTENGGLIFGGERAHGHTAGFGHTRLRLVVSATGDAVIEFLDDKDKIVRRGGASD